MTEKLKKIRRECTRLGKQLAALPSYLHNLTFGNYIYDHHLSKKKNSYKGKSNYSPRIAIYVIYPSRGLKQSHVHALNYLQSMGYAAEVVSNCTLNHEDREKLLNHCWRYIERPNYGYDFGGYRDGILAVSEDLKKLERLVLLNDSTWFPLPGGSNWLYDAEALNVDFAGAVSHFGIRRPKIEDFQKIDWTYSTKHFDFHYGSFALSIGPKILKHPDFISFWKKLRLSNNKKWTIRRGEIGFTQWVLSKKFSHGATLDISTLEHDLGGLREETLQKIAETLILPEIPQVKAMAKQIIAEPKLSREKLTKVILYAVARQGASYVLAHYTVFERRFPFLKKSPLWLNPESAETTLQVLQQLPNAEDILKEAIALRPNVLDN